MSSFDSLVQLLKIERIEENIFRGVSCDLGFGRVFGGQVLGQALTAATRTVEKSHPAHSLHAYFLRPGDVGAPILYQVSRIRDGGSFTTRHVLAIQHGRPIFDMSASFHIEEPGFEHQSTMLDVPPPEELKSYRDMAIEMGDDAPKWLRNSLLRPRMVEIRPLDPVEKLQPDVRPARRQVWFRVAGRLPDDYAMHRAALAYASDFELLGTALLPHRVATHQGKIQSASLDHALWIHRRSRADEWMLYSMESPNAFGGLGLIHGHIFSRDGALIASATQEALIRPRE